MQRKKCEPISCDVQPHTSVSSEWEEVSKIALHWKTTRTGGHWTSGGGLEESLESLRVRRWVHDCPLDTNCKLNTHRLSIRRIKAPLHFLVSDNWCNALAQQWKMSVGLAFPYAKSAGGKRSYEEPAGKNLGRSWEGWWHFLPFTFKLRPFAASLAAT